MPADRRAARRAVAAAVVGNVLEWYDFAVYAYMARLVAKTFFPTGDEVTSLLSTFAAFGVGFVMRPLGGILIGRLGDVKGRKAALIVTVGLMAGGTVMIGLTPSYQAIGLAAPLLVVRRASDPGFLRRRRMGHLHRLHRRVGACAPARVVREPAAVQCRGRIAARFQRGRSRQHALPARSGGRMGVANTLPARRPAGSRRLVLAAPYRRDAGVSRRCAVDVGRAQCTKFVPLRWPRAPSASQWSGPSPTISSSFTCRLSRRRTPG